LRAVLQLFSHSEDLYALAVTVGKLTGAIDRALSIIEASDPSDAIKEIKVVLTGAYKSL